MTTATGRQPLRAYGDIGPAWQRLAAYLGEDFRSGLTDFEACCTFVEKEFARYGPEEFYRSSNGYLYELTHFHFSPYKDDFFRMVTRFADAHGLRTLGDVGCGVGLDAQALMRAGYQVSLYDMPCPSLDYAAWRLQQDMGTKDVTFPLDHLGGRRLDLVYAVDVIEHIPDPAAFAGRLFGAADYVAVNFFPHDPRPWDGKDMHYPENHWTLLPAFGRHGELLEAGISGATVGTMWRRRAVSGAG
ncbi:bifunctional 2-polyprenyl-6-hydroxyphenol methylase/3-demethylubiquinol 3-O-methyltransferase UbiG [Streptomyces sp. YIM 98790]|uniref:class I SAM-dependent methyltransferase n=1 Tax=Streptomyces sp. YIM 98790 TaxID=2689077 RepID=UPI001408469A|nr:methyltransferase domain-containing protein [Streptomyces sp. YIM 98790]